MTWQDLASASAATVGSATALGVLLWRLVIRGQVEGLLKEELADRVPDRYELRRFRRFFTGNGTSELHQLRNQQAELRLAGELMTQRVQVLERDTAGLRDEVAALRRVVESSGATTQDTLREIRDQVMAALRARERDP